MAPFDRPVRADDIARSPEMALRYPAEEARRVGSTADEGVGTGFDNAYPFAYVEHWFDTADDPGEVVAWYRHQLSRLGWNEQRNATSPSATAGVRDAAWSRSGDETIALTWFGPDVNLGWSRPSHRLSYTVAGSWPDGGDDPRPQ